MKIRNIFLLLSIVLISQSCSVEADPINFGTDQCHFCKMNIVDKVHAAQYVTKKGKQYKFDAIECMVDQVNKIDENELSILLVSDYGSPGDMTDALKATYLISPNIKSPMGANLSGFADTNIAQKTQSEHQGQLLTWEALKKSRK